MGEFFCKNCGGADIRYKRYTDKKGVVHCSDGVCARCGSRNIGYYPR